MRALAINDAMGKGAQIELVSETGAAQGCHLHFKPAIFLFDPAQIAVGHAAYPLHLLSSTALSHRSDLKIASQP